MWEMGLATGCSVALPLIPELTLSSVTFKTNQHSE